MAPTRSRTRVVAGAIVLLAIALVLMGPLRESFGPGKLRLPTGNRTPVISLGERHGLVLASDGSLWSWGSDFLGWPVLGLGNRATRSLHLRRIGNETNWVSISAGTSHNLALKSDGTLWTWGESVGPRLARPTPIGLPVLAAPGHDWKQAAAGGIHSVAVKQDGTLWGWGNNWAGSAGIDSTNGSFVPVQVGSTTNWVRVWASMLETVGMQSDGTLWYWGDNPNPAFAQGDGQITAPMRISADTNWVDVGFGVNTVFAIKSDGTLWAWGRHAHTYTGVNDPAQDVVPARVGTNSDWRSLSVASGWWCQGLTKKDGSLWLMDASEGKPNGPRTPSPVVHFRRAPYQKDCVAYAAGAVHAAAPGIHGPIGVVLTRDGEVWAWGLVLGDPPTVKSRVRDLLVGLARFCHFRLIPSEPEPTFRETPWRLRNVEPGSTAK